MVVYWALVYMARDLKVRYGALESQPDSGCTSKRENSVLEGVAAVDVVADGADDGTDDPIDPETVVGVAHEAFCEASWTETLLLWLLLSIALPMNPPIRPAAIASSNP
jgi:hypothetical protein